MKKYTINDENLLKLLKTITMTEEIKKYINMDSGNDLSIRKRLLKIPQDVAYGKFIHIKNDASWKLNDAFWKLNKFESLLEKMEEFEWLLTATGEKYRSNYIHQIRVCLLGYFLMYECGVKNKILQLIDGGTCTLKKEDLDFVWLYASLFHDIGYLVEKLDEIQERLNEWTSDFELFSINCAISIKPKTPQEITKMLEDLKKESNILRDHINDGYEKRDHGIISALIVRNTFGLNWRDPFILPGIQAMAIHNLKKEPVKFSENPIAFLLILCDEIQEWDRSSRMWGHAQLINPLKSIKINTDCNDVIKLRIYYDFFKPRIIKELQQYEEDFCLDDNTPKWSEEAFATVKCDDLKKKLSCDNLFDIEFNIKTRKKNMIKICRDNDTWILK